MTLTQLYGYADERGYDIDYFPTRTVASMSFPCGWIAIDRGKLTDSGDEKAHLAHEIGHLETGAFYNAKTSLETRSRLEARADRWAIKKLVPPCELFALLHRGVTAPWELAEHFGVPQRFMEKALEYYQITGHLH